MKFLKNLCPKCGAYSLVEKWHMDMVNHLERCPNCGECPVERVDVVELDIPESSRNDW
jgi:rRNA maturation protein Nop10